MTRSRKDQKAKKKRNQKRRDLKRRKRRQLLAGSGSLAADTAHELEAEPSALSFEILDGFATSGHDANPELSNFEDAELEDPDFEDPDFEDPELEDRYVEGPELETWWEDFWICSAPRRMELLRQKLSEPIPEDQPDDYYLEAIFECESGCKSADYVAFLEEVRLKHPKLYEEGLHWFMRSRVSHFLNANEMEKLDKAVSADIEMMTGTDEPFYGTMSMLRLAGRTVSEALAEAGYRCMDESQLMPWARDEILAWVIDTHIRACAAAGPTSEAFGELEEKVSELRDEEDDEFVKLRRELVLALAQKRDVSWQRNQLIGTTRKAGRNRFVLGYDFAGWLANQRSLPTMTTLQLRKLLFESVNRDHLRMQDFLDGLPQSKVDRYLATHLGFLGLDPFHAPASLIAIYHFVHFLHDIGLVRESSVAKSDQVVASLRSTLDENLIDLADSLRFLDPLWCDLKSAD